LLALTNLSVILQKGAAFADAKKIDPAVLINARLAPDMFPLSKQVQIATDVVKGGAARLAGIEIPSFPDTETTFPELEARVQKCIAFLKTITEAQLNGAETRAISLKAGGNELKFTGLPYVQHFVVPNLYFHVTIAYAILRHNGVDVGKMDFLGAIQ
jgi:hypothetical protein